MGNVCPTSNENSNLMHKSCTQIYSIIDQLTCAFQVLYVYILVVNHEAVEKVLMSFYAIDMQFSFSLEISLSGWRQTLTNFLLNVL